MSRANRWLVRWGLLLGGLGLAVVGHAADAIQVRHEAYRGWNDAVSLGNGVVETIVVPSVGRVMQFRFVGSETGPFWENEKLVGQRMPGNPWEAAHGSFGGDKTWPAPQSAWNWPPPDVFDATPLTARVNSDHSVVLESGVSPSFGIQTRRRIVLSPGAAEMRIETTYQKVSGDPVEVGVWVITQTRSPEVVLMPVPAATRFPAGSTTNWGLPKSFFRESDGLVQFTRDPRDSHKIGNDGEHLVWVGERELLHIEFPRNRAATYPDGGCSVEVYSNPDPVPYVELETLGPLRRLSPGDHLSATNTYRLYRREPGDPLKQARRILESQPPR